MRRPWLLFALVACQAKEPRPAASPSLGGAPADSVIVLSASDTGDHCGFIASRLNPDPLALVRDLVARDGRGEFLQPNPWLDTAYLCPAHLPAGGPDAYQLITASAIRPSKIDGGFAKVPVVYVVIGASSYDVPDSVTRTQGVMEGFKPLLAEIETDTVLLVRTEFGWRIVQPGPPERLEARGALAGRKFWTGARAAIEQAIARAPALRP